jgi:circadian clock protein KaiC
MGRGAEAMSGSGGGSGNGDSHRAATGVPGLDYVLAGGLPMERMYLLQGSPGAGKTTMAMQFLLEGARRGEAGVYATLSETEEELRGIAASHGWLLDGITICDLQSTQGQLRNDSTYTLFHPSEVELSETTRALLDVVDRVRPARLVIDSLSEMRLLARDPLRYRRQILSLKQYFTGRRCTVILLDYAPDDTGDSQVQSLTHGLIVLEHLALDYGGQRRRLRIQKVRGVAFREGFHDFSIERGGAIVYPRLVAADHGHEGELEPASSDLPELDELLGGGIVRGTSTMLMGPSGVGKTTIASQYAFAAARRGERSAIYLFDEVPAVWIERCKGLGMDVAEAAAGGRIALRRVDPAELSPGEFAWSVRQAVESGVRVVIVDSLNGYQNAMVEERFLGLHMRELLSYLNEHGILSLLVLTQHGLIGSIVESPIELSYLADNVILLRYFEAFGKVRQAISVVKKRTGSHERTIRELNLGAAGPRVGEVLAEFQGILGGELTYVGSKAPLSGEGSRP